MPAHWRIRDLTAGIEVHKDTPLFNNSNKTSQQWMSEQDTRFILLNNPFRLEDSIYEHFFAPSLINLPDMLIRSQRLLCFSEVATFLYIIFSA